MLQGKKKALSDNDNGKAQVCQATGRDHVDQVTGRGQAPMLYPLSDWHLASGLERAMFCFALEKDSEEGRKKELRQGNGGRTIPHNLYNQLNYTH